MATAVGAAVRSRSLPGFGSRQKANQLQVLQDLCIKHLDSSAGLRDLAAIASKDDFTVTTHERGIAPHRDHAPLITALDTLNTYQRDRRSKSRIVGGMQGTFKDDPRTRLVELLKRWIRTNAASSSISEDEVRRMGCLCSDVMNYTGLFPSRNAQSFMNTIALVHKNLEVQLRKVLEKDRSCAELAERVLTLSRNLISDAIAFLLVGPTDLKKTDQLPSLEVEGLWQSLPSDSHPLPSRIDTKMQRDAKDVWNMDSGSLIACLLRTPNCIHLLGGADALEEATKSGCCASIQENKALNAHFQGGWGDASLKGSGLAGNFRKNDKLAVDVRTAYLAALDLLVEITYLTGKVLGGFHRVGGFFGDYGMIKLAVWLHPLLEELSSKVRRLQGHLEALNTAVVGLVRAKARGETVEKPIPSELMKKRAQDAIHWAVVNSESHAPKLLQVIEELRQKSSPDRMPAVAEGINDACRELEADFVSQEMILCVGDRFQNLPRLSDVALGQSQNQIADLPMLPQSQPQLVDVVSHVDISEVLESEGDTSCISACSQQTAGALDRRDAFGICHTGSGLRSAATPQIINSEHTMPNGLVTPPNSVSGLAHAANPFEFDEGRDGLALGECLQSDAKVLTPHKFNSGERPAQEDSPILCSNVARLTSHMCGGGLRIHDRRGLRLQDGLLDIMDKGSLTVVKTELDVVRDIEECCLLPGKRRLSLTIRRAAKGASLDSGVTEHKAYFFEFYTVKEAIDFHNEINRLQGQ